MRNGWKEVRRQDLWGEKKQNKQDKRHSFKHIKLVKLQYIMLNPLSSPAYLPLALRAMCVITLQHTLAKVISVHVYGSALPLNLNTQD